MVTVWNFGGLTPKSSSKSHDKGASQQKTSVSGRIAAEGVAIPQDRVEALCRDLARNLSGEVRFSIGDRSLYATDASNYRQIPFGVVVPKSAEDVVEAVKLCSRYDVPITPRGGGTSLAGQTCNTAIIIDFSKYMHRVLSLDAKSAIAVVEPGCILDHLRDQAEEFHLTFGPDPATHDHNTLGGMIGNDSCGVHSIIAGRTADNVESLEIVTYDGMRMSVGPTSSAQLRAIELAGGRRGEIYRQLREFWNQHGRHFEKFYPKIPRRISGYENLDQLSPEKGMNVARALVGTEATCAIVLNATVKLVPSPRARTLVIVGFDDVFLVADAVGDGLSTNPMGLEAIDHLLSEYMKQKNFRVEGLQILPRGNAWLISEFGADNIGEATQKAGKLTALMQAKGHDCRLVSEKAKQKQVWEVREAALAVTARIPGDGPTWPGWEDSAVPREKLGDYLRKLKALFRKHDYQASVYGHFGDGLVHCRINFDLSSEAGLKNWRRFLEEAADLVVGYGGSLSGEHGDGQARADLLERMYGPDLMRAQCQFRAIWDPSRHMNPGKVLDPYPATSNLRVGPSYQPREIQGLFGYPEDGGSFTKATLRCVGVGKCRRRATKGGVMCPSYLGTDEEKHSTRGRARLLFEMMRADAIRDGFANAFVEEALDLCLGCKGCKRDCPVNVDMARYKAEFRSRHYTGKFRPRAAYAMGQIQRWAAIASHAPMLANAAISWPVLSSLAKWLGGIAGDRSMPAFASPTYRRWHKERSPKAGGTPVVLWPDTFNNFFRPRTAIAATQILEHFGFEVRIPSEILCCGRPLYDWGWVEQAKTLWRRSLNVLKVHIDNRCPIIGLEPACVSAFRDELPALFPNDPLARALSRQTRLLSEFLEDQKIHISAKTELPARAIVQYHCHHHAILDKDVETHLLSKLPIACEILNTGCFGMAGSFGFERNKYDLSLRIAERGFLPHIRGADPKSLIVADGFSCREQIEQLSGRKTEHFAELLARALTLGEN